MRLPFATQSYQSRSLPLSAQRLVNLYAEAAPPNAKTPVGLLNTPGLKLRQTVGNGPIRGMIEMGGDLFVVSGPSAYRVESNGDTHLLGTVGGTALVFMAHNGTQVAILVGQGTGDLYIATTTTLVNVTDSDYPGASSVAFVDGYFAFSRAASGQFFISGSYDGTAFDAADFATAEGQPDPLVRVLTDHRELWLFGERTTEIWYNSGDETFPFERASGAYLERGCIAGRSPTKLDNSVFWVGDDRIVYRADGYTPKRISTHAIEKVLTDNLGLGDLVGFAYSQDGHAFYVLKKPDTFTFVYDVATGLWHERESHERPDWRVSTFAQAFNQLLVGDDDNANIYALDLETYTENGQSTIAEAASPTVWAEAQRAQCHSLVIDFEMGIGLTSGQGSDPQAMLDWSDDGGKTWSNQHWRSIGKIGEYKARAKWNRLGQFRQRVFRVRVSDPVKRVVNGAYAEMSGARL